MAIDRVNILSEWNFSHSYSRVAVIHEFRVEMIGVRSMEDLRVRG